MRYGRILAAIDAIPRELAVIDHIGDADCRLVADRLDLAARQVRGLVGLFRNDFPVHVEPRRRHDRMRGAA